MKEKNYGTLRSALDRLPDYTPGPAAWKGIAGRLDRAATQTAEGLGQRLPTYAPPPGVWNAVSQELDNRSRTRIRVLPTRWLGAAAAAVAVMVLAVGIYLGYDGGPEVTYAYGQEAAPAPVVADWDDDEASFARARQEVAQRNDPHLNNLGHELDELTLAREEVKAMLVAYGEDPQVINQLADIERERDDIYRRIIVEL